MAYQTLFQPSLCMLRSSGIKTYKCCSARWFHNHQLLSSVRIQQEQTGVMASQKGFLFLECEGSSGRSAGLQNKLKNRHAQLSNPNGNARATSQRNTGSAPLAIQIKFKASEQSHQPETYFGRCGRCKKRRKVRQSVQCKSISLWLTSMSCPAYRIGARSAIRMVH